MLTSEYLTTSDPAFASWVLSAMLEEWMGVWTLEGGPGQKWLSIYVKSFSIYRAKTS